jgi:putative transposase
MKYPASEKLEIIRLVEHSALPVRHTLGTLGIPRATFYRWYDRYSSGGPARCCYVNAARGFTGFPIPCG